MANKDRTTIKVKDTTIEVEVDREVKEETGEVVKETTTRTSILNKTVKTSSNNMATTTSNQPWECQIHQLPKLPLSQHHRPKTRPNHKLISRSNCPKLI